MIPSIWCLWRTQNGFMFGSSPDRVRFISNRKWTVFCLFSVIMKRTGPGHETNRILHAFATKRTGFCPPRTTVEV